MHNNIPAWALRVATADDQGVAKEAHRHNTMRITWPNQSVLRNWAKQHGWPTPIFGFEEAFLVKMLETQQDFEQAMNDSGIEIHLPRQEYRITQEKIQQLDALYERRSASGRPANWGTLVEELREIRRAVEAGILITLDGDQRLHDWQSFYSWAHGRYHMLEDGYDKWIGDDG
jgi:hypothetical protein